MTVARELLAAPSWQALDHPVIHADCLDALRALPDCSVDAIVTDPPYGLSREPADAAEVLRHWLAGDDYEHRGGGFMGKSWDSFAPGPTVWREALRVLRPGGHLLAFGGTRTYDLLVLAVRLAGFEIRDTLCWLYGSGFPKSLDVAKAIDRAGGASPADVGDGLIARRHAAGLTRAEVAEAVGASEASVRDWEEGRARRRGGPVERVVPSAEYRARLDGLLGYPPDRRERVGDAQTRAGDGSVIGLGHSGELTSASGTGAGAAWEGWGTALKPAHEPIVVARKPLAGTVAETVLAHGTGALHIDACRIEVHAPRPARESLGNRPSLGRYGNGLHGSRAAGETTEGRWPANVLLDEDAAAILDGQSGVSRSRAGRPRAGAAGDGWGMTATGSEYDDEGGASRFFYIAKASPAERNAGLATRNDHETVKPIALMRWLLRLVTPPDGVVLDLFAGSGTTVCAGALERITVVGIEREAQYVAIARARASWWAEHPPGVDLADQLAADADRSKTAAEGQLELVGVQEARLAA